MRSLFIFLTLMLVMAGECFSATHQFYGEGMVITEAVTGGEEATVSNGSPVGGNGHGADMSPLLFVILALIIGAAIRHLFRKSPLPYTVLLLIVGLGLGVATRLGWFSVWHLFREEIQVGFLGSAVSWAGHIDPHLILYVFLPTLIFEAAFAMDVHTFRKSFLNASILAIPGIIMAMFLSGALVMWINTSGAGLANWNWAIALMFGAVISATDPVAVVSLLKELGASKKLGTLIEGESLLNDGTAIVLFMVYFSGITGTAEPDSPVIEFFRVALGGILVGMVVGWLSVGWVRRVFNDALVEISVIIAAAYITFYICEHFFHVSGVLGLVAFGLAMASVGRTRISPEVEHFLHEFWELAAFIANTLIFLIVGVVIAQQVKITWDNLLILALIYAGVHLIRSLMIVVFYPLMKRLGYGLSVKDAAVLWWGALRGAIALSLALIVAAETGIAQEIRDQFLFLTAGIVTLTLLINATTIKWVVEKLGLTRVSPAIALMRKNARQYKYQSVVNYIEKIKEDRFLHKANWKKVREFLPDKEAGISHEEARIETIAEIRRRVLEKEKSSYWHQFKDGMLGPTAVRRLSDTIDEILDAGGLIPLSARKDLEESWKTPRWLVRLQSVPLIGILSRRSFFEKLARSYESARGFVEAQEEALKLVESMGRALAAEERPTREEEVNLAVIEEEINENKIHGLTFLRNLRKNFPEIYSAISTRQAIRSMLNYERRAVERLQKNGRISIEEAEKMSSGIEERMKKLMYSSPLVELPEAQELLRDVPWLQGLEPEVVNRLLAMFQTRVFSVGEKIIRESSQGDGLFFIARGTVKVTVKKRVIDVLGYGTFIGEMAGLTGLPRTAEVVAESPVTALWISSAHMNQLMSRSGRLQNRLWRIAGARLAENLLRETPPYNQWKQSNLRHLIARGSVEILNSDVLNNARDKIIILLHGRIELKDSGKIIDTPSVLEWTDMNWSQGTRVFIC